MVDLDIEDLPFEKILELKERANRAAAPKSVSKIKKTKLAKNEPMEMSSKRRPKLNTSFPTLSKKPFDPRFSSNCGHLNIDYFQKSYAFMQDERSTEKQELRKFIQQTKKNKKLQEQVANAENELQKMVSQDEQRKRNTKLQNIKREFIKSEKLKVSTTGKKPFYIKEGHLKKMLEEEEKDTRKGRKRLIRKSKKEKKKQFSVSRKSEGGVES